jgi:pimeloyl-ACP methyl ester carboxylesterase
VIYGTADSVVDPEQSRAVAAAAGGPVDVVQLPGADHNDPVLVGGPQVIDAVVRLADRAGCSPRP